MEWSLVPVRCPFIELVLACGNSNVARSDVGLQVVETSREEQVKYPINITEIDLRRW